MKLTDGYAIREIAGNFVAVPIRQHIIDFNNRLDTNESGAFILKEIHAGLSYEQIIKDMTVKYKATEDEIPILRNDLNDFLYQAKLAHLIEDEELDLAM